MLQDTIVPDRLNSVIGLREYKVICPLLGFQIPVVLKGHPEYSREERDNYFEKLGTQLVEGIELVDGVRIRRMSKEDVEDINRYSQLIPSIMDLSSARFVLTRNVADEHNFLTDPIMKKTVLGLRLLKDGYVSGNFIFYISLSDKSRIVDWSRDEGQRREYYGWGYALDFEEIPALKSLLEKLQRVDFDRQRRLGLACKRFGRAYEEDDSEDQLIDLMIALEALFVKKEVRGTSAKQKIANDCSDLLGIDEEEKRSIRDCLVEAYAVRNYIVHGSDYVRPESDCQIGNDFDFMENLVQNVEGLVRDSIKTIIGR
jgi:hypothetical protein